MVTAKGLTWVPNDVIDWVLGCVEITAGLDTPPKQK